MANKSLFLTIALSTLAVCWARPADIVARVPSNYYKGTKWVLFKDNSVADPPPYVIQAENNVQVLPSYQYPQQQQQQFFEGYHLHQDFNHLPSYVSTPAPELIASPAPELVASPAPVHYEPSPAPVHYEPSPTPVHFEPTPAPVHFEPSPAPVHYEPSVAHEDYNHVEVVDNRAFHGYHYDQSVQPQKINIPLYAVAPEAVHVTGPTQPDYLRKKKSVKA